MGPERDLPDEQLVSLSRNGDLAAFNSLVARYEGPVFNLCYRLLGRREPAEDAAQEAFLSAYRSLAQFGGGNVRSWLLRIAANESRDELRRRKRKDTAASLDEMFDSLGTAVEVGDPAEGPSEAVERGELHNIMQAALGTLPFDQRHAIALVDLYGYRYDEVADMTGASVGTIKSRVSRGRGQLRALLTRRPELLSAYRRLERQRP